MPELHVVQPRYFERFQCLGSDCEDTCCNGWGVIVDHETYEKYQDPQAGRVAAGALTELVEINPASISPRDHAKMRLVETHCCALSDGLCSIQQTLGEPLISDMCSSFPRVLNATGGGVERSLHLSCPEAARLALSGWDAMELSEHIDPELPGRPGSYSLVEDLPDQHAVEIRQLMIHSIRDRSRPLWQRIAFLGLTIDQLATEAARPSIGIVQDHLARLKSGSLDEILESHAAAPAVQFEIVVELIVARFAVEYTSPRFLECYGEFMRGLGWTGQSTMEELGERYQNALRDHFLPFVQRHEYFFENYLVNYMFRTLFPYGRKQRDLTLTLDSDGEAIKKAYLLFALHFAIIRTVFIGMAALHRDNLNIDHALKLVQSCSKAFQHSNSVSALMLQFLTQHADHPMRDVALLVMD